MKNNVFLIGGPTWSEQKCTHVSKELVTFIFRTENGSSNFKQTFGKMLPDCTDRFSEGSIYQPKLSTYFLTIYIRYVFEKQNIQLSKKFPTFHRNRSFIAVMKTVRHGPII
jgi:hypothetical protein